MAKETDVWMPIIIGDYLKDTQDLDALQHGCYFLWLMHYWIKGPLPDDLDRLVQIGRLSRFPDAQSIAQRLLGQFFVKNGDGAWHQKRADIEKARWDDKRKKWHDKATHAAAARHAQSTTQSNTQRNHQGLLGRCPSPSPSPSPSSSSSSSPSTSAPPPPPEGEERKAQRSEGGGGLRDGPLPAAAPPSLSHGDDFTAEAHMVAREVTQTIGVTSHWVVDEVIKQAKLELQGGKSMDTVRDGMITQWNRYQKCVTDGKTKSSSPMNAQRFFGEAIWKDSRKWNLKKGMTAEV